MKFKKYLDKTLKTGLISALTVSSVLILEAKDKKGVIMTVDGEEVPTEEFLYLYNKNNMQQPQPQTIDEYLDLFETYRIKVAEAKRQGVDTAGNFKKEMEMYRRELLEPYITDTVFFNQLVNEAAEREKIYVESSHIMIIRTHDQEKDLRNIALLDSLRKEILNGADFITIAKNYSQDKFSADKGGYLGFTPAGTFPYGFETAEYETPEGEISDIVESHVGWHLVKSGARKPASEFKRPAKSYEEVKADVTRKVTSPFDPRFHQIRNNLINRLKAKHPEVSVEGLSDDDVYNTLILAEENSQYNENPEYRNLVDEYVNGSLLYEVSVENVWNKAANDTEGLNNYYNQHADKYKWTSPHAKGILVQTVSDSIAQLIKDQLINVPSDSIIPFIRKNYKKETIVERFNLAQGSNPMVDNLMFGGEKARPKIRNYDVYFILEGRLVEEPEGLDDVKSAVINDYQVVLEDEWVSNLKRNHKVEINKKELSDIKKKLKQ